MVINATINQNPHNNINESFAKALTELFNGYIKENYPNVKSFDIQQGFFTSGQYGSNLVSCYDENKNMLCYIICDVILGDYKVFEGKYPNQN
jgi:hypothetical protein